MGDRCYLSVDVLRRDREKFIKIADEPDEEDDSLLSPAFDRIVYTDANFGLQSQLENAARAGLAFIAYNDAGDDYGPGAFLAFGGNFTQVDTDRDANPVVGVPIHPDALARAEGFLKRLEELKAMTS